MPYVTSESQKLSTVNCVFPVKRTGKPCSKGPAGNTQGHESTLPSSKTQLWSFQECKTIGMLNRRSLFFSWLTSLSPTNVRNQTSFSSLKSKAFGLVTASTAVFYELKKNLNFSTLRKSKFFTKSRFSRNRQWCRPIVI